MIYGKKPIMSPEVENAVLNAVAQFRDRQKWAKWGMNSLRKQGPAILLKGPPGCGKGAIAEWIALSVVKRGMHDISFGDFGSHIPGENARQIRQVFQYGKENKNLTLRLNECEAILWDRSRAGSTAMWMLEVIDEILVQLEVYKGFVILSTNKDELLDYALERRLLASILVTIPTYQMRIALWRQKIPKAFPLKLTIDQIDKLSELVVTGAEVEIAIINCASDALRTKKNPTFATLQHQTRILADIRAAKVAATGSVIS